MQTIDEISIGRQGEMFTLTVYHYSGPGTWREEERPEQSTTFLIGLPDQLHAEVEQTIGKWLEEGERTKMQRALDAGYQPQSIRHDLQDER